MKIILKIQILDVTSKQNKDSLTMTTKDIRRKTSILKGTIKEKINMEL